MTHYIRNTDRSVTPRPHRRAGVLAILLSALAVLADCMPVGAWPFADYVIEYRPGPGQWATNPQYNNPIRALGRPYGGTVTTPDNSSLVTLGDGGSITLGFDRPVWDDPRNPHGLDFIVFGNATWVGGNPAYRWLEPAFVEISMDADGNGLPDDEWFLLLPNKLPSELIGSPAQNPDTGYSRTVLRHYAEYTPTLSLPAGKSPEEFYTVPNRWSYDGDADSLLIDEGSGGGDAFDIALAVRQSSPGVPVMPLEYARIPYFNFIRITDAITGDSAGVLGEVSAEVNAVTDVSPLPGSESIGEAKKRPDGDVISLAGKVVTVISHGEIYIQEEDRSSGIQVRSTDSAAVGDRADVIGILRTEGGERLLERASIYVKSSGTRPRPLGMRSNQVGPDALGTTGLLVTSWGRVTAIGEGCFHISDGSLPYPGLRVRSGPLAKPSTGDYVTVTGASTRESEGGSFVSVIIPGSQSDIVIYR